MSDKIPPLHLSVANLARVINELYAERDDNLAELCFWLHGYCLKVRHVWGQVLHEHGITHDLCLDVWAGNADAPRIAQYIRLAEKLRKHCGETNKGHYAQTSVATTMWHQLNVAHEFSRRGLAYLLIIIADAGEGKTTLLQAHERENNHGKTTYVRARVGGIKSVAAEILQRCGGDPTQNYPRVMKQVYESFWPGRHLSLDEAHLLIAHKSNSQPRLEFIRGIVDIGRCSGCLCFTEDAFESGLAECHYNFRQLTWRGLIVRLPRFPERSDATRKADIQALLRYHCPNVDPGDELVKILDAVGQHEMGGFGGIAQIVHHATVEAEIREIPLTGDLIKASAMMQYDPGQQADEKSGKKFRAPGSKERTLQIINSRRSGGRRR